jgi:hypothetical protein
MVIGSALEGTLHGRFDLRNLNAVLRAYGTE